jgi:hypothetical protein
MSIVIIEIMFNLNNFEALKINKSRNNSFNLSTIIHTYYITIAFMLVKYACNALYYNLHLYHLQEPLAKQVTMKLLLLL